MVLTENVITMAQPIEGVNGQNSVIIRLRRRENAGYSFSVAAKSATGICTPCIVTATPDALSVFFYCRSLSTPSFSGFDPRRINGGSGGADFGQAGAVATGSANPVRVTTNHEICTSGGGKDFFATEIDACQRPLPNHTHNLPTYFWLYAAVTSRTGRTATKSPPPPMTPPAALWRVITWLLLLDACQLGIFTMFKIIITTDEYMNDQRISTESAPYYRRYKTRAAAEKNAARMGEIIQAPGSPLKYVTTAKIIEVNHA